MGCTSSKQQRNNNLPSIRICSFCVDTSNTFNKYDNITKMVDYYFTRHNGKNMDIMALQGIDSVDIYQNIIKSFDKKIKDQNSTLSDADKITLYYYPFVNNPLGPEDEYETWSLSDKTTEEHRNYTKLFISRYEILMTIEDTDYKKKSHNKSYNFANGTNNDNIQYSIQDNPQDKLHVININVNNIIVSIYNVDIVGEHGITSNEYNERIKKLNKFIDINTKELFNYCQLNEKSLIDDRHIHIICGNFGINEIKNKSVNKSYVRLIKKMQSIDIFRYVTGLRGKNSLQYKYDTNIFFSRNNYILMKVCDEINKLDDFEGMGQILYENYGIFLVDAHIEKDVSDIFIHYPTEVVILFKDNWGNKKQVHDDNYTQYHNIEIGNHFRNRILNDGSSATEDAIYKNKNEIELSFINSGKKVTLPYIDSSVNLELYTGSDNIGIRDINKISLPVID